MTAVRRIGADNVFPQVAPRSPDAIRSAISPVLDRLGRSAHLREEERDFAEADVRELAEAGIALTGISSSLGGAGGTVRDVVELVIDISRADSNVAQALRPTFLVAQQISAGSSSNIDNPDHKPDHNPDHKPDHKKDSTLTRLQRGQLFAGTVNERSGGENGSVHTTARRVEAGWVVDGSKYYSTGAIYADWFSTVAIAEDGQLVRFTVPTDRDGIVRVDDFDAIGQRLTQSGSTIFRDVFVADEEVTSVGFPEDRTAGLDNPWTGAFPQLYLAAVQAGIAARVLDDAVRFVNERARPIKHSTASQSAADPYVRETVGNIAIHAQVARAVVLLAAESVQDGYGRVGEDARSAGAKTAVIVAQAGSAAIDATLKTSELLFDVGGASATDRELGFDRHWRNSRTAANHNPRQWKAAVSGAWHIADEEPPTSGLF